MRAPLREERAVGRSRLGARGLVLSLGALCVTALAAPLGAGASPTSTTTAPSTSTTTTTIPTSTTTQPVTTSTATTSTSTSTTSTTSTTTTPVKTWLGPDGVESSAVIAENNKRGTRAWYIPGNDDPTAIQGFANRVYARDGQNVGFYVNSTARRFKVVAFRMGWYHGAGARAVWRSTWQSGVHQPACTLDTSVNMVSCANWSLSLTVTLGKVFVPGDYLFKLYAGKREQSYVPLTVWDPTNHAAYVVSNRSMVEQGWNTYGGYSYYAGQGACTIDTNPYPVCNRARVVSFDRPYSTGFGSSDFLTNEYPLVRYMEQHGLDVTYVSDVTINDHPNLLLHHRTLLSLDHDETWTYAERMGVLRATRHGVNVAYFGAAAMVRHARLEASPLGPNRQEVDYRNSYADPLNGVGNPMEVTGNTWWSPPSSWPPVSQIGVNYSGYLTPRVTAPMVIADASSWAFRGTGLTNGSTLPGVIGSDFDHVIASSLTPSNIQVLAHSPIPAGQAQVAGGIWGGYTYSDMVYFTDPRSRAGVLDTGNNIWIGDLRPCAKGTTCASPILNQITGNVLHLFGRGPAGKFQPSRPNLASIVPAGS